MSIIRTIKVDLFCDACGWQLIVKGDDENVIAQAAEERAYHLIACPRNEG